MSFYLEKYKMKLLIAPAHYSIDRSSGSEVTRAYEYIEAIAKDESYSGDIIVGYTKVDKIGNFKIHCIFKKEISYVSIPLKFYFILLVFLKYIKLTFKNKYDCIWHLGPFGIDQTFSLVGFWNRKRTRLVIGPIYTPFPKKQKGYSNVYKMNLNNEISKLSWKNKIDILINKHFNHSLSFLSILTLKSAHKVITIDNTGKTILLDRGIKNTLVIPLGIQADDFILQPRNKKIHKYSLLTVSYLVSRKRVEDLIEAILLLRDHYKLDNFHLTIVGDGPRKADLELLVTKHNLTKFVKFEGFIPREEVSKFYKNADIFLSGSIMDSMPGMYFEAMSASLPMVLAENITSLELQQKKFGGIVVKGKRPDLIAKAIVKIINSKEMYTTFSARNYHLIQTDYNFDNAISNLKKTFVSK